MNNDAQQLGLGDPAGNAAGGGEPPTEVPFAVPVPAPDLPFATAVPPPILSLNDQPVDAASETVADAAAPPRRRFCGVCGETFQEGWSRCEACAARGAGGAGAVAGMRGWGPGGVTYYGGAPGLPLQSLDADRPKLNSAIVLYFALLAVSVMGMISIAAGASELSADFGMSAAMSLLVIIWCLVAARPVVKVLFRPAPARWFIFGATAALATFGLAYVVVESLVRGFGLHRINYTQPFFSGGYGMATVVLMICVQPAIFEELAFRGVVFGALQPTLSSTEAVFVSAGMFMILHLSPAAFPHTFAMGVIAGFMRARTGSLLPGVLMHFVHNLLCVVTDYSPTG